eukprot:gene17064-biopygen4220
MVHFELNSPFEGQTGTDRTGPRQRYKRGSERRRFDSPGRRAGKPGEGGETHPKRPVAAAAAAGVRAPPRGRRDELRRCPPSPSSPSSRRGERRCRSNAQCRAAPPAPDANLLHGVSTPRVPKAGGAAGGGAGQAGARGAAPARRAAAGALVTESRRRRRRRLDAVTSVPGGGGAGWRRPAAWPTPPRRGPGACGQERLRAMIAEDSRRQTTGEDEDSRRPSQLHGRPAQGSPAEDSAFSCVRVQLRSAFGILLSAFRFLRSAFSCVRVHLRSAFRILRSAFR